MRNEKMENGNTLRLTNLDEQGNHERVQNVTARFPEFEEHLIGSG